MTVKYSVSFEFATRPPLTHRGTVSGSQVGTCVSRATREAQAVLSPKGWSSMVCVLLERLDTVPEEAENEPDKGIVAQRPATPKLRAENIEASEQADAGPTAADAVDPQAPSTGKPTTRV